jgi:hypothetical protein
MDTTSWVVPPDEKRYMMTMNLNQHRFWHVGIAPTRPRGPIGCEPKLKGQAWNREINDWNSNVCLESRTRVMVGDERKGCSRSGKRTATTARLG